MTLFRRQVATVIAACELISDIEHSWFDRPSGSLPGATRAKLTSEEARRFMLSRLEEQLYSDFYCRGSAEPERRVRPDLLAGSSVLVDLLSEANSGRGPWEAGWRVDAFDDEQIVAVKDGLRVWAPAGDCLAEEGGSPVLGSPVKLRLPKELLSMSPGFYLARGDRDLGSTTERPSVRLYWNLTADGAPAFISLVTTELNEAGIPFQAKVLNHPALYFRCDAAVLYVVREDFAGVAPLAREIGSQLAPHLRARTPALTKPMADGLGLAEDPGGLGESFGSHRCRLLAEGLIAAHERGVSEPEERLDIVAETFAGAGIDLDRPYLNPGSVDSYTLPGRA
jgi:class II lanthipeptide synthase